MRNIFGRGLWHDHPALRQLLGMCSTLAITTTVMNAIFMGCGVTFVLVCSAFFVSLIRKLVPAEVRIAVFAVIIATFVTIVDKFFGANFPDISRQLGPYVPLIIVNCIILGRCEAFACRQGVGAALLDGLAMGLGYTWVLVLLGVVREAVGFGTVMGRAVVPSAYDPLVVMILPAGAFILLGLLVAGMNAIEQRRRSALKKV